MLRSVCTRQNEFLPPDSGIYLRVTSQVPVMTTKKDGIDLRNWQVHVLQMEYSFKKITRINSSKVTRGDDRL